MENAKKSMVDVLNMNPSVNLMGTADLSVAYSKDFTRLVVSGQEKDLQERVLLSQDIAALLILQIMNGVSCDDAQAALELNYTDTGKQEVKELAYFLTPTPTAWFFPVLYSLPRPLLATFLHLSLPIWVFPYSSSSKIFLAHTGSIASK